jgi:hypothetical protein
VTKAIGRIKDVLLRDPATHPLVNNGQARIADKADDAVLQELRGEVSTFVCERQYAEGIHRILNAYLAGLGGTSQKGAWVSGFYGSGKSHLLKMLTHLWIDTKFPDGATARGLVPDLPDDIRAALRELDTAGKRGGGLLAAAGALPAGSTEHVRLTVLGVLLRAAGLPEQYPQAMFSLWLHEQGWLERVRSRVEKASGKAWASELNNLYVSRHIPSAVRECDPSFGPTDADAKRAIQSQFPPQKSDITSDQFLDAFRRVLRFYGKDGKPPCTLLILDEVQQYIGDSNDRSTVFTDVAEAVSKELGGKVMIVGAGQSALNATEKLSKLLDRFTVRVPLSDTDVETVTRRVLLQKRPDAVGAVRSMLDSHAGEVSRQLANTRIAEGPEDREVIVDDYPILPVRRRFWEHCFRVVDAEGTQSQLRSQLRIVHDAVAEQSDRPLGAVVPADELFEQLAPEMVNKAVLPRELNERLLRLKENGKDGELAYRLGGLIFLIGKLPREAGADIGVRATPDHLADLLVDDLAADNGRLRSRVEAIVEKLAADGVLMRVGDEYRLQTREGAEWDAEFRRRQAKLGGNEADLQLARDRLLYAELSRVVGAVKPLQGEAREQRALRVHRGDTPPPDGEGVAVWARDEWSAARKEVEEAARRAGAESPAIHVFIPKHQADDLRRRIIDAEAAEQTLQTRGVPTTTEGTDARLGMQSRRDLAIRERDALIREIVTRARVFQGGGTERLELELVDKLRAAADDSLVRLYPQFKAADAKATAWEQVIKRAREGSDHPFEPVRWAGSTEDHPVCQQVRATIGAGKSGSEVRKVLEAAPYGWPRDAIDAALIALHRMQHVSATLNGAPVPAGQLDQNRIAKAEFRVERATLSVEDRLAIRGLFTRLGIKCGANEEAAKAPQVLQLLSDLVAGAGGAPPLPAAPESPLLERIRGLVGNEQLAGIAAGAKELEAAAGEWKKRKELTEKRRPGWETAERLARHASAVPAAAEAAAHLEAIRSGRQLLASADPVPPVRRALAEALRGAVSVARVAHESALRAAVASLETSEIWRRVPEAERAGILAQAGVAGPADDDVSTDEALAEALERRPLAARLAEAELVAARAQKALELAAKLLEPKVRPLALERTTLRNEAEVRAWLERQEERLLAAVKDGPVLVS